jgi:hypothetical protein
MHINYFATEQLNKLILVQNVAKLLFTKYTEWGFSLTLLQLF